MKFLNILLVDDSEDDRYFLKRTLKSCEREWYVMEAESAEQGLDALQLGNIDIVLLDYSLPGSDGLSILTSLNHLYPSLPIIMLTGQGSEKVAAESIKKGASDYISKNGLTKLSLMKSIKNALDSARLHKRIEEKNRELSQFAYVLAHDLKQPANAISRMSGLVALNYQDSIPDSLQKKLELINQSSKQMYDLINALVCYTRLDLGESHLFEATDIDKCIELAKSNLKSQIESVDAVFECGAFPSITAIPSFVVQLFQNLFENSIKYCEVQPVIKIACETTPTYWHFTVQDNGLGIPSNARQKVFEPLARLHNKDVYLGSGLGLATAKRIVNIHCGEIYFSDSGDEIGSKLNFTVSRNLTIAQGV
ncbi:sensor histidine kinase [Pseudoalteromonas luteoviolacea]|uniref:sensor histidine kinase n=1 Tax=Pseudoalteromonas luteoviolacea TaxID=43657 RepID=UPI001428983D|nr:hybrid sensor histidine kinase/response regulator [Pseudoalteromonas luteoviolacea]